VLTSQSAATAHPPANIAEASQTYLLAWQSIRQSLSMYDTLVMRLLMQSTMFIFIAFGVIFVNAKELGQIWTGFLCLGVFSGRFVLGLPRHKRSRTEFSAPIHKIPAGLRIVWRGIL
jgi:hypothetical protein